MDWPAAVLLVFAWLVKNVPPLKRSATHHHSQSAASVTPGCSPRIILEDVLTFCPAPPFQEVPPGSKTLEENCIELHYNGCLSVLNLLHGPAVYQALFTWKTKCTWLARPHRLIFALAPSKTLTYGEKFTSKLTPVDFPICKVSRVRGCCRW